jgi:hypothetical protein
MRSALERRNDQLSSSLLSLIHKPPANLIARWYRPQGHRTFSRLTGCLAAREVNARLTAERRVL